jgi:hypothetical protein
MAEQTCFQFMASDRPELAAQTRSMLRAVLDITKTF